MNSLGWLISRKLFRRESELQRMLPSKGLSGSAFELRSSQSLFKVLEMLGKSSLLLRIFSSLNFFFNFQIWFLSLIWTLYSSMAAICVTNCSMKPAECWKRLCGGRSYRTRTRFAIPLIASSWLNFWLAVSLFGLWSILLIQLAGRRVSMDWRN